MIAGCFQTPFGDVTVVMEGTPTPEQIKAFLPDFEQAMNLAVREYLKQDEEHRRAASN